MLFLHISKIHKFNSGNMSLKFLIWGGNGWIGSMLKEHIIILGHQPIVAKTRLQDYNGIVQELEDVNPDFVLLTAGIVGRPTIDWCEGNKQETYHVNTVGAVNLAHACWTKSIHLTNYSSGCIYHYDDNKYCFSEEDEPNFTASTYSDSKVMSEKLLKNYPNVLILRLRMPISDDMHPKSLITKLSRYNNVIDNPNSVTVLRELLPISIDMTVKKYTGIYNFTNPGTVTHSDILNLYKKYINPEHVWNVFSEEEQNKILAAKRSTCELNVNKLLSLYNVPTISEALETTFKSISSITK